MNAGDHVISVAKLLQLPGARHSLLEGAWQLRGAMQRIRQLQTDLGEGGEFRLINRPFGIDQLDGEREVAILRSGRIELQVRPVLGAVVLTVKMPRLVQLVFVLFEDAERRVARHRLLTREMNDEVDFLVRKILPSGLGLAEPGRSQPGLEVERHGCHFLELPDFLAQDFLPRHFPRSHLDVGAHLTLPCSRVALSTLGRRDVSSSENFPSDPSDRERGLRRRAMS
jgi:hypothetical protein